MTDPKTEACDPENLEISAVEAEWVKAIRDDEKVGRGSCASIDECYTDQEIVWHLRREGVASAEDAVKWAYKSEGLWREQGLNANCDSGEPLDPYWTEKF